MWSGTQVHVVGGRDLNLYLFILVLQSFLNGQPPLWKIPDIGHFNFQSSFPQEINYLILVLKSYGGKLGAVH
jgi:hypothetical protein